MKRNYNIHFAAMLLACGDSSLSIIPHKERQDKTCSNNKCQNKFNHRGVSANEANFRNETTLIPKQAEPICKGCPNCDMKE